MNHSIRDLQHLNLFILIVVILTSCQFKSNNNNKTEIDFSTRSGEQLSPGNREHETINVAVSAIISPQESFHYYNDLLDYFSEKTGKKIEVKQRKTYEEVNGLLEKNMVDLAFICSGAYVTNHMDKKVKLLAVPVCNGKPFYQAYIIVNKESPINNFAELKGKSFAYTDPLSNSGKLYAVKLIHGLGGDPAIFFSKTIHTYAHDNSIQMVTKQMVDGATIDGLIYEYLKKNQPERVENIKIIHKSENFGIPPVVVPIDTDEKTFMEFQQILFTMHTDSIGKAILDNLLIDKFEKGEEKNYESIKQMRNIIYQ